jgi:hypothetical protein
VPEIRLLRKYAAALDGFDLTHHFVGEVFVVNDDDAAMLEREGWAELTVSEPREERVNQPSISTRPKQHDL